MTTRALRDETLRWLRVAALIVVALVALRTVTTPRAITTIASETVSASHAERGDAVIAGGTSVGDEAVEARPVRRARQLHAGLVASAAVLLGMALLAAAAASRRHPPLGTLQLSSRAVPALGGRGPPTPVH